VGTAPGAARIWTARKDWAAFGAAINDIFDAIAASSAAPPEEQAWLDVLAKDAGSIDAATDPYELAIVPPELLTDVEIDPAERDLAINWAYQSSFDITASDGPNLTAKVRLDGNYIGTVSLTFTVASRKIVAEATWSDEQMGFEADRVACAEIMGKPDHLRIYYDGATLADGFLFNPAYQDRKFTWDFRDFAGYSVEDEKPKPWGGRSLADVIAKEKSDGTPDESLFAYVVEKLCPTGWLASDDGAMEFADFVHIDPAVQRVTLIHVKGSGSANVSRQVSVANYEVVVGQAVKNIRHLNRTTLEEVLRNGVNKKIAGAVWRDGVRQADRDGIIAAAAALRPDHSRTVIVLQPQLTERERDACYADPPPSDTRRLDRMRQLDTLMLSARLSCGAVGADFIGIGSE
jgi:hypothetical protein